MVNPTKEPIRVTVQVANMGGCGFAGYVAGSVGNGEALVGFDLHALLEVARTQEGVTAKAVRDTLVANLAHELLHVAEDVIDAEFHEELVEQAVESWIWAHAQAHRHQHETGHDPALVCHTEGGLPVGVQCNECGWSVGRDGDANQPLDSGRGVHKEGLIGSGKAPHERLSTPR